MALSLSVAAAQEIRNYLAERGQGLGIRLVVQPSECSGMAYKLEFVDTCNDTDQRYESHGACLFVDPKSLAYADGTVIDYVSEGESGENGGFAINNPNVKSQCGCGDSFYV